ncbi:MAG: cupredoxin domain-containing protein [Actinomycetota bacterium]|nr:cupredoxin domain-containing protein [Actinomycetota bacterium]
MFVIGAAGSAVLSVSAETDVALPADEQVIAEKVTFLPPDLQVASGTAGVWVDNKDGIRHTFTIDELGVNLDIPALKARRVEFQAGPGTYTYRCTVPGHDGMTGTLVVGG